MARLSRLGPNGSRWLFNCWPPFLFAGIRVLDIAPDWSHIRVRLRRHWFNSNFVGTHFGGSLFAMTDPFWMIPLIHRLGPDYLVWDQAATIDFIKARREDVFAEFSLDEALVDRIRQDAADGEKHLYWFDTEVKTGSGELVARTRKQIYVRLKPERRPDDPPASSDSRSHHG
jgi:acyl-coenzyme A thioesterase PaaI-like protein